MIPAAVAGVVAIAVLLFGGDGRGPTDQPKTTEIAVAPQVPREAPAKPKESAQAKEKVQQQGSKPDTPLPEPRFTFYKELPQKEVIISESEIRSLLREEGQGKRAAPGGYWVQAGSFAKLEEAERVKEQLAGLKVKAKMEKIISDNTAWYRVKIGPYGSLVEADKMRTYLRANRIDSRLQKAKD